APLTKKESARSSAPRAPRAASRKLSYLEQREWSGIEAAVLAAEARVAATQSRTEDPSISADAGRLLERFRELDAARAEVDRLYARWAELEEKQRSDP
ncbi:MAG TPA: ABC transporter C-terminal domain-containing protein, partial [Verrucomicrobiae bacterium]|nr:ABC transporter C-terminal domain-containing protein [Verrucomicrobiae bacterium]